MDAEFCEKTVVDTLKFSNGIYFVESHVLFPTKLVYIQKQVYDCHPKKDILVWNIENKKHKPEMLLCTVKQNTENANIDVNIN